MGLVRICYHQISLMALKKAMRIILHTLKYPALLSADGGGRETTPLCLLAMFVQLLMIIIIWLQDLTLE
jgi:hypothetical protein